MSTQSGKDVIYIDVDDEITTLIDHVRSSHERIVALVLPKRATVLQSIVNMKLLKRTASESKKQLVLITAEPGLIPLAAAVGLYVAKTLQSKPEIPPRADGLVREAEDKEETVDMNDVDAPLDKTKPVGDFLAPAAAAAAAVAAAPPEDDDEEPIELDNTGNSEKKAEKDTAAKAKKDKSRKVPNFNKFRMWLFLGAALLIVLVILGVLAFQILPKAHVDVKTNSTAINTTSDLTLDTNASSLDAASDTLPATQVQTTKTDSQTATATGQQNNGQKAAGQVNMTAQACAPNLGTPNPVAAGTGITANGLTFITQQTATFSFTKFSGGSCAQYTSGPVDIVAQNGGSNYNIAATTFTVPGRPDVSTSSSSAMTGGTDNIIQIVSQADIDNATQKLTAQDTSSVKAQLQQQLESQGLYAVANTFSAGTPSTSTSANAGDQASSVTVTQKTMYTMLGVEQSDLQTIVKTAVDQQIDTSKQSILDYGLSNAVFKLQNQSGNSASVSMTDTAIAGSSLDVNEIKQQAEGKNASDAEQAISSNPGVTSVKVTYSPFWVNAVPKQASKISVTIEKPSTKNAQ